MTVMVAFFRFIVSFPFTLALINFYLKILDLAKVYRWQKGVLPLALEFHTHIVQGKSFILFRWETLAK